MKSLGTWAAIAVATAFAHDLASAVSHHSKTPARVQRSNASDITKPSSDSDSKHCTVEINAWRKELDEQAQDYQPLVDSTASTDLSTFLSNNNCDAITGGTFNHLETGAFVISATKSEASRSEITCAEALQIWKGGFEEFEGEYPAQFKENEGPYQNPNAVALVSLLSDQSLKIFCGNPTGCTNEAKTIVCYFKPSGITQDQHPVSPQMWHKVEEHFLLKPKLVVHDTQHQQCLDAVNGVRGAEGLNLAGFTGPSDLSRRLKRAPRTTVEEYQSALYNLTCDELNNSSVDPAAADGYTIIYSVKDSEVPGPVEAVDFWKTGYEQLGTSIPPVFKPRNSEAKLLKRDEEEDYSEIYYDSAVAGYVSIMADEAREMRCFDATGCNKHALVCVLKDATLQENEHPISEETWRKILKTKGITKPVLTRRSTEENCHDEINALRTREGLDLKPFSEAATEAATASQSTLLDNLTCEAIEGATVAVTQDTSNAASLIYHHGPEGTCAEAVDAWKQGYEHFSEVDALPAYNSTSETYTREGATNFLSIMTPKTDVSIACYTATGCSESALVCELKPAALKEGDLPMTNSNWEKVSEFMAANSAAHTSSTMALLSSAILAAAAVALQL